MKTSFVIVALLSAFSLQAQTESAVQPAQSVSPANQNPPPLDPKNMDAAVKPQDDFYLYANGGWLKHNPVPPEYSRWGSFSELEEKNNEALHKIAERTANAHADANTAPEVQKVGDYYASGMDEKTIEAARTKPLEDELKRIDAIKDRTDLLNAIARTAYHRCRCIFRIWLRPGCKRQHARHCAGAPGRTWSSRPRLLHKD